MVYTRLHSVKNLLYLWKFGSDRHIYCTLLTAEVTLLRTLSVYLYYVAPCIKHLWQPLMGDSDRRPMHVMRIRGIA